MIEFAAARLNDNFVCRAAARLLRFCSGRYSASARSDFWTLPLWAYFVEKLVLDRQATG